MGPKFGDAASVGYELLYSQVTRAQGIFSPRTVNITFSLEYICLLYTSPSWAAIQLKPVGRRNQRIIKQKLVLTCHH